MIQDGTSGSVLIKDESLEPSHSMHSILSVFYKMADCVSWWHGPDTLGFIEQPIHILCLDTRPID